MSRWIAGIVILASFAVGLTIFLLSRRGPEQPSPGEIASAPETVVDPSRPPEKVTLYFPGPDLRLHGQVIDQVLPESPQARLQLILQAWAAGPDSEDLWPPLPPGTTVEAVRLLDEQIVVALRHSDFAEPPASGTSEELLRVFGLVATAVANHRPGASVVILWNDRQLTTFSGQIDTTRPLRPRPDLLAAS